MKKKSEFEEAREKKARPKKIKSILAIFLVILSVGIFYAYRFEIAGIGVGVMAKDAFALMFDNKGYPVETEGSAVMLESVGKRIAAVSDTGFEIFNEAGNKVLGKRVNFRSPTAVSHGGKLLIFSQGGKNMSLYAGDMMLFETKTENPIYNASLSPKGMIAYSTSEFGYQSSVHVLDENFDEFFIWVSSDCIISSLKVDKAGKTLAACGITFNEGEISSDVHIFDISSGVEVNKISLQGELVLDSEIFKDGNIAVITDKAVHFFTPAGISIANYSFNQRPLNAYGFFDNRGITVSLGDFTSNKGTEIVRLDSAGQKTAESFLKEDIGLIDFYKENTIAFSNDKFIVLDESLKEINKSLIPDAICAHVMGDYVYYSTESTVERIHL